MEAASVVAPSPDRRLRTQWVIIGVWAVLVGVLGFLELREEDPGAAKALAIPSFIASVLAQAAWITFDCRRHQRPVGGWRFGAIFFGPLAIWMYFVAAYGRRALYLIPLSILVYAAPFLAAWGLALISSGGVP